MHSSIENLQVNGHCTVLFSRSFLLQERSVLRPVYYMKHEANVSTFLLARYAERNEKCGRILKSYKSKLQR